MFFGVLSTRITNISARPRAGYLTRDVIAICSQGWELLLQQHFEGVGAFDYTRSPRGVDAANPAWRKCIVQGHEKGEADGIQESPTVLACRGGNEHYERSAREVGGARPK